MCVFTPTGEGLQACEADEFLPLLAAEKGLTPCGKLAATVCPEVMRTLEICPYCGRGHEHQHLAHSSLMTILYPSGTQRHCENYQYLGGLKRKFQCQLSDPRIDGRATNHTEGG
jgi:hypothetical protein